MKIQSNFKKFMANKKGDGGSKAAAAAAAKAAEAAAAQEAKEMEKAIVSVSCISHRYSNTTSAFRFNLAFFLFHFRS